MARKLLLLLLAALFVQSSFSQGFNKAKMDSLLDAIAVNNKAMLSIAISQNGKPLYSRAIGYSIINANQKVAATTQTRYRIGSVTKVFTAAMIFQLIDEGKLQLSTPLSQYFADISNADKITVAHLLNHSSGLHNLTDSTYHNWLNQTFTQADLLAKFKTYKPEFEPGSKHEYSNTNFVLLGYIIETIDKKSYPAALKTRILNKAGLKDTYYGGKINSANQEAYSYNWQGSWQPDTETDMSIPGGAGALVSTPTDLIKFIEALFNGKLVSSSSLNQMKTIKDGFGMNLFMYPFYTKTGYGHGGAIDGFRSELMYYPEEKLAVAYTVNGANTKLNDINIGVLSIAFNHPYTLPVYTTVVLKSEDLDPYLGMYASKQIPLKLNISKKENTLIVQATGQQAFILDAVNKNTFKADVIGATLSFDAANKQMTLKQGGNAMLFTKE